MDTAGDTINDNDNDNDDAVDIEVDMDFGQSDDEQDNGSNGSNEQQTDTDAAEAEAATPSLLLAATPTGKHITEILRELKARLPPSTASPASSVSALPALSPTPTKQSSAQSDAAPGGFDEQDFISFAFIDDDGDDDEGDNNDSQSIKTSDAETKRLQRDRDRMHKSDSEIMSIDPLTAVAVPPWVPGGRPYSRDMLTMLNQEIDDYLVFVRPTHAEQQLRWLTIERVRRATVSVWPDAVVSVFGSFETQLYLPSSDVDIIILGEDCTVPHCLHKLSKRIKELNLWSRIEVIDKAKVPIIKGVDALSKYSIDISFNASNGIQSAQIVKKFLADPFYGEGIRPLMLILKQFLAQRNLNETFTGGLGSYGLLILIASFLMMHPMLQAGSIRPRDNLGILLIEFFELYGNRFNFNTVGIGLSTNSTWYFPKERYANQGGRGFKTSLLSLIDPQDEDNDVGRGSYNFHLIQRQFHGAYNTLQAMIGASYEREVESRRSRHSYQRDKRLSAPPVVQQTNPVSPNTQPVDSPSTNTSAPDEIVASGVTHAKGRDMITMLGSILTVRREVLVHREHVQKTYEDLPTTNREMWDILVEYNQDLANGQTSPTAQKRKRGAHHASSSTSDRSAFNRAGRSEPEVVYIEDSSSGDDKNDERRASHGRPS
eukprot:jgi/Hompol1/4918/HPOL_001863-RA